MRQKTRPRHLTDFEKRALAPYIPRVDLDAALLHDGRVPVYLGGRFAGVTRGNHIYLRPGAYDPLNPVGLALLGHELVHVGQYRNGMTWLHYLWSVRLGYSGSAYEQAAVATQAKIHADLTRSRT